MKKGFKIFLIVAGAVVLLLGIGVGLLFVPGVQKKLVLSALSKEAVRADLHSVRVALGGIRLSGLSMVMPNGVEVSVDAARIKVPVLDLVLKGRYDFDRIEMEGLKVDLRHRRSGEAFGGVLTPLSMDGPVSVGELAAEGRIVLAKDTHLEFTGSGSIGAGQESRLPVAGRLAYGQARHPFEGELLLAGNPEGGFSRLAVDVDADLSAGKVAAAISASAELQADREAYWLGAALEKGDDSLELFTGEGSYHSSDGRAQFSLKGRAVRKQLLDFAPQLVERLPPSLLVDCHLQGGTHGGEWRVEAGNVDASMDGLQLAMKMLQPFTLDFDNGRLAGLDPGVRVLSMDYAIPASKVFPTERIKGPRLAGTLFLESAEGGFVIRGDGPVRWTGLSLAIEDDRVTQFTVVADPSLERTGALGKFGLGGLKVVTRNATLLEADLQLACKEPGSPWAATGGGTLHMVDFEKIFPVAGAPVFRSGEDLEFTFAGTVTDREVKLEEGQFQLGVGLPWLSGKLSQPLVLRPEEDGAYRLQTQGEWMEIQTRKLNVGRFSALDPRMLLEVEPVNSRWGLAVGKDAVVTLRVRERLVLERVTFAWDDKYYVRHEPLAVDPEVRFSKDGLDLQLANLLLGNAETPMVTGEFHHVLKEGRQEWGGTFEVQMPLAARSILFKRGEDSFTSGVLRLELGPDAAGTGVELGLEIHDAVHKGQPEVSFGGRGKLAWPGGQADGKVLDASFEMEGAGRKSMGQFTQWAGRASLNVGELHLPHLQLIADAYSNYSGPSPDAPLGPFPALELKATVGKLYATEGKPLTDMQATVFFAKEGVALREASAALGEKGRAQGHFTYHSTPARGSPNLSGEVRLSEVQLGDFFKKPGFGRRAPLEGLAGGSLVFDAVGERSQHLLDSVRAQVDMSVVRGSFRFHQLEDKLEEITKLAKAGGQISEEAGKLGGALTRNLPVVPDLFEGAGKIGAAGGEAVAGTSLWLGRILKIPGMKQMLRRIEFDAAAFKAERASNGPVTLNRFDMRGSRLLVRATGKLGPRPVHEILDAPMTLSLYIGVKGLLPKKFLSLGQLDTENEVEGYTMFKTYPVGVGGTVRDPNLDILWDILFPQLSGKKNSRKPGLLPPGISKPRLPGGIPLPF